MAVEELTEVYGSRAGQMKLQLEALLTLPSKYKITNSSEFRKLASLRITVKSQVNALKALGLPLQRFELVALLSVEKVLPKELRMKFIREKGNFVKETLGQLDLLLRVFRRRDFDSARSGGRSKSALGHNKPKRTALE